MVEPRMTDSHASQLGNDVPLSDPAEDRLHRSQFAEHLAQSILAIDPSEGFVFALTGPWGSGKTTILNFTERLLKDKTAKRDDRLVIVHFNAWWISGSDRFLQHFFKQFRSAFNEEELKKSLGNFLTFLTEYAAALEPLPYIGGVAAVVHRLGRVKAAREADINGLRWKIDEDLKNFPGRILVVIDDIDRLRSDEIRLVFRLVKAVANFPRTIYLLAYDEPVVVRAVGDNDSQMGREYLNKIVQLPLVLPSVYLPSLQAWFFQGLDKILEKAPEHLFNKLEFDSLYSEISRFLTTPRNVNRFLNLLRATYPLVRGEVNAVDFIGIQALRQFAPTMYEFVAYNKYIFCPTAEDYFRAEFGAEDERKQNERKYFNTSLESAIGHDWEKDRSVAEQAVRNILGKLFPSQDRTFGGSGITTGSRSAMSSRENCRIDNPDIFDRYFFFGPLPGDVSETEFHATRSLLPDYEAFGDRLKQFASQTRSDGTSRLRLFLDRLIPAIPDVAPNERLVHSILHAIYDIGDELYPEDQGHVDRIWNLNHDRILSLTKKVLEQLRIDARESILDHIFRHKARALLTMAFHVYRFGEEHGEDDSQRTVRKDDINRLQGAVVERIRNAVQDQSLQKVPLLGFVLHRFAEWASVNEARDYVSGLINNDEGLCDFLAGLQGPLDDFIEAQKYFAPLTWPTLSERSKKILETSPGWLTKKHREALQVYVE